MPMNEKTLFLLPMWPWLQKILFEWWVHRDSKVYESILEAYGWDHLKNNNIKARKILPCFAWLNRRVLQKHVLCCMKWRIYLAVSTLGSCIHLWNKLFLQMDMISINTVQSNLWHICCRLCKCGLMCWLYRVSRWFLQDEYSKYWSLVIVCQNYILGCSRSCIHTSLV